MWEAPRFYLCPVRLEFSLNYGRNFTTDFFSHFPLQGATGERRGGEGERAPSAARRPTRGSQGGDGEVAIIRHDLV